jgi:hypothetical protein
VWIDDYDHDFDDGNGNDIPYGRIDLYTYR